MRGVKKRERIETQRAKPRTPTTAIDALIRKEEQTGEKRRENKERNRERVSNPATLDKNKHIKKDFISSLNFKLINTIYFDLME